MKLDLCIYEALSYTSVPWKPHSWAWLSISTNINYANIWEYTVEGGADDGARYQTCYANSTKGCIHGSIWKGSIVLDRPSELWSLEAIQLLQTTPTWLVTCPWPNGSAVPLMSCTCTIHGFVMAGAAPTGKTKQSRLRTWASWTSRLVGFRAKASYPRARLVLMQSTDEHANPQWCHWQV